MNDLWLHSTKYDGSLHYRYPLTLVQRSNERLITYCAPGVPVQSHRGPSTATKHLLSLFWRDRPYVLHVRWDSQWQPEFLYVDIATATSWIDQTVRYIDLDLDLILRHNATSIHLDDEDEFEAHRFRWNYPDELVQRCWAAVQEVRRLLEMGKEPFAPTMFCWRPGQPLRV
jgi:protein associated with RNAse G/E